MRRLEELIEHGDQIQETDSGRHESGSSWLLLQKRLDGGLEKDQLIFNDVPHKFSVDSKIIVRVAYR